MHVVHFQNICSQTHNIGMAKTPVPSRDTYLGYQCLANKRPSRQLSIECGCAEESDLPNLGTRGAVGEGSALHTAKVTERVSEENCDDTLRWMGVH